ncbi:hypothetical protein D9756_002339 [Leucocoprinus leucothites]|uniref:F-box domain-containing protein n=1 Tax=Leucocoprinus leucothites TaxID=201217 RepID=A0A8H5GC68_9AGAR|nr:hypothetical protein D9756_002339 [Leucoagaricus leucothites]
MPKSSKGGSAFSVSKLKDAKCTKREQLDQKLEEIKKEVEGLQSRARELRGQCNELAPMSILPPEVLAEIFIIVRNTYSHDGTYDRRWIRVTHVCQSWRDLSLSFPALWSVISDFTDTKMAHEMLERAQTNPLAYCGRISHQSIPESREQYKNILARIHQVKSLDLTYDVNAHDRLRKFLVKMATSSTPYLASIRLAFQDGNDQHWRYHVLIPNIAFKNAPCLTSVTLERVRLSWRTCFLHRLRLSHLKLCHINPPPTLEQIICVLEKMPELVSLALVRCLPRYNGSDSSQVHLNYLESLVLDDELEICERFLAAHLRFPRQAQLRLRCNENPFQPLFSTSLLSTLAGRLLGLASDGTLIRRARMGLEFVGSLEIWVATEDEVKSNDHSWLLDINVSLDSRYGLQRRESIAIQTFQAIFLAFPFSGLYSLVLEGGPGFFADMWDQCCGSLPHLESIWVQDSFFDGLCSAMGAATYGKVTFPALKILVLDGIDFVDGWRDPPFPEIARSRKSLGVPLDEIRFRCCYGLQLEYVEPLQGLIDRIKVNDYPLEGLGDSYWKEEIESDIESSQYDDEDL